MEIKEILFQNKKLLYRTAGKGFMIVLLHGFSEDGSIWHNQFNAFPGHQLIIPDLPGSGGSEAIDDMSIEGLAEAVKFIIMEAPAIIIGHSMGGYIALAFAEKYPESVIAFGLFHSTAYADSEEKKEARRKGIAIIKEQGAEEFLKATLPNLYAPQTKEAKSYLIDEQLAAAYNFSGAALVNYYEALMKRQDRTEVLQQTNVPVLFVMGRWDAALPLKEVLLLCYLPQLSYIHILDASGHMGMIEERDESNKILTEFITAALKPTYT